MDPGGVEDEPKTENVEFPLVLKHFQLRENGGTTEIQRRNNGGTNRDIPAPRPPVEAFLFCFYYFSIILFEPLLEPLHLSAVREIMFL